MNDGARAYPKQKCEDKAVLEVAKVYQESMTDLSISVSKQSATRKTITLNVELISSWADDTSSGDDTEASFDVTLQKSGCKLLSLSKRKR